MTNPETNELRARVASARQDGDGAALAALLLDLAEATPLFNESARQILDYLADELAFPREAEVTNVALEARRLIRVALALLVSEQLEAAVEAARRAAVLATESQSPLLAREGRRALATVLGRAGTSPNEAWQIVAALEGHAKKLTDRPEARLLRAQLSEIKGDLALNAGDQAAARAAYEEALQLYKPLDERVDDARYHTLMALSVAHQQEQNMVRALTRLKSALGIAERHAARIEQMHCRFASANLLTGFNRYDEALAHIAEGTRLADEVEDLASFRVPMRVLAATNLMCTGRHQEAQEKAEWALRTTFEHGDPVGHMESAAVLSAAHRAQGNDQEAYRVLSFAAARLEVAGQAEAGGLVRRMIGELREQMGPERFDQMAERMYQDELARRRLRGD
jgi:tetratricopeptide (TPR) repeat protein